MKNYKLQRLVPYVLISGLALSSCAPQSECALPARHFHLYTKPISSGVIIEKYVDSEDLTRGGYNWQKDCIEVNAVDEKILKRLDEKGLFSAEQNWDYLYYRMSHAPKDFMEFYYSYTTLQTYTTTDSKGHTHTHVRTVHHSGWHDNASSINNTGRVRVGHNRYYAFRVNYSEKGVELEQSPYVDDIREVISDYPYVAEDCDETIYAEMEFSKDKLPYLTLNAINPFNGPDLSNKSIDLDQSLSLEN